MRTSFQQCILLVGQRTPNQCIVQHIAHIPTVLLAPIVAVLPL